VRGEVAALSRGGKGLTALAGLSEFAEAAPHPNPLRASFARLDPARMREREHPQYAYTNSWLAISVGLGP